MLCLADIAGALLFTEGKEEEWVSRRGEVAGRQLGGVEGGEIVVRMII